jgi:hypothetical protein
VGLRFGPADQRAVVRPVAGRRHERGPADPGQRGHLRDADLRGVELHRDWRSDPAVPRHPLCRRHRLCQCRGFPNTNNQFGPGDPYSAGITNGPLSAYSDTSGSAPAPSNWANQGLFSTSYSDPTAHMPNVSYESGDLVLQPSGHGPAPDHLRNLGCLRPDPGDRHREQFAAVVGRGRQWLGVGIGLRLPRHVRHRRRPELLGGRRGHAYIRWTSAASAASAAPGRLRRIPDLLPLAGRRRGAAGPGVQLVRSVAISSTMARSLSSSSACRR